MHSVHEQCKNSPVRGLVIAKYGTRAASTRQRFVQAMPYLQQAGIALDMHPLFDDHYLNQLFVRGTRHKGRIIAAYLRRLVDMLRWGRYDFLLVQYELFPYLPLEWLIRLFRMPIIVDYDDAIFHQYDNHANPLVRRVLGQKLVPLLRHADLVMCGNAYIQQYVQQFCPRTEIIPTVVDTTLYMPSQNLAAKERPTLGWIGSPSTWGYVLPLVETLKTLVDTYRLSVLVVGAGHAANAQHPFAFRDWSEVQEIADIQAMDIGIMPVPDEPWARGKCGYKLIQYMACGLPVIASPVGVNTEIVEHGVNGFLASSPEEWRTAIEQLIADPSLRKRMGEAGRRKVEARYSIQVYGAKIAALIQKLLRSKPTLEHQDIP